MNANEMINVIIKLINLPRKFSHKFTVSIYDLLKETGYFDISNQISEQDIYNVLIMYPDLADDWLKYSEDKRCNSGLYFMPSDNGGYLVGCLNKGGDIQTEYNDRLKACAAYIKREIDQIKDY